jgi:WD40 repeat protein
LTGHTDWVRSCSFAPDGTLLATASDDHTARIWDVATGSLLLTLDGHGSWVTSCCFSPDGRLLATASFDRAVRIWNVGDGLLVRSVTDVPAPATSCAFSHDGTRLATTCLDGSLRVVDVHGNDHLLLSQSNDWLNGCAFLGDDMLLAAVGDDCVVRLWDVARHSCVTALRVAEPLYGCAWHPTGTALWSVGRAGVYGLTLVR